MRILWALTLACGLLGACGDRIMIPDDSFDGNVVVGDASRPDFGPEPDAVVPDALVPDAELDAGAEDATAVDTGIEDVTPDVGIIDGGVVDASTVCATPPEQTVTSTQAVTNAMALDGLVIEVTGVAVEGNVGCTELVCPPEDACCNTCEGPVLIDGQVELIGSDCRSPGCRGTNCRLTCTPATLGLPERFIGLFRMRMDQPPALELYGVRPN